MATTTIPEALSVAEEMNLVKIVLSTETAMGYDEDGNTVTRYFPNEEQENALVRLLAAYDRDIKRASRSARVIDREEAVSVATEEFIRIVRNPNRTNDRLAGYVSRAMVNAVMNADAEASPVRIPPDTLRRYMNLVKEAGTVDAAYENVKAGKGGFDPATFLAINRALNAESKEKLTENRGAGANGGAEDNGKEFAAFEGNFNGFVRDSFAASTSFNEPMTDSPEDSVVQADFINWLFTQITESRGTILRLAFGFDDDATEAVRYAHGYSQGEILSDAQIAPIVRMSRAKVQRERTAAIVALREAIQKMFD